MEYKVILADLPERINGFTKMEADGFCTIVLNAKASSDQQRECYRHELEHIIMDDFGEGDADQIEAVRHEGDRNEVGKMAVQIC